MSGLWNVISMYLNESFRRNVHCGNESGGIGREFDVGWESRMVGVRVASVCVYDRTCVGRSGFRRAGVGGRGCGRTEAAESEVRTDDKQIGFRF